MSNPSHHDSTFRRGPLERALWSTSSPKPGTPPSPRFLSRIKKLLDLDRTLEPHSSAHAAARAFSDHEGLGQGIEAQYRHFNAFCLALALELLDAGFKQSEVVIWVRLVRRSLENEYERIMQFATSGEKPNASDIFPLPGKARRCYMLADRVQQAGELPELAARKPAKGRPIAFVPKFFYGADELGQALVNSPSSMRRWLVIECAHLSVHLRNELISATRG